MASVKTKEDYGLNLPTIENHHYLGPTIETSKSMPKVLMKQKL
jgi:hypothetical protein